MKERTKWIIYFLTGLIGFPLVCIMFKDIDVYYSWVFALFLSTIHLVIFCFLNRGENGGVFGAVGEFMDKWKR